MAQYGRHHHITINGSLESLRLRRDMFDGNEDATLIKSYAISGTVDPLTEEVQYHESVVWHPLSGIVHTIVEGDSLIGLNGRARVGDTVVTYHYDTASGIYLNQRFEEVKLLAPGVSGVYQVSAQKIQTIGGRPILLKIVLQLDANQ